MKKELIGLSMMLTAFGIQAQSDPEITSWLINTNGTTGRHYVEGNSTPITDSYLANVETVEYSDDYVYVHSAGIPSYIVGPYMDGNPALATDNEWIFKIPRVPAENTGNGTETPLGSIGVFINGVPMYNYSDAMSYNSEGVWNRDAVVNEMDGFDCAKGHPSPIFNGPPGPGGTLEGGSYHHHQNPTAFNLDLVEVSDVCDLYLADGLYTINASEHSPLIGFAFDGYPVYGAYGYANTDGTGGIVRMESSYQLRNITVRTHLADGTDVSDGPAVSSSYPLGTYQEDYEYVDGSGHLDEHNGRFCVTPEFPNGTYAYFATVDENWNSAYPYMVGPTYYGVKTGSTVTSVTESTTTYDITTVVDKNHVNIEFNAFPNPSSDVIAVQISGLLEVDMTLQLFDMNGKLVKQSSVNKGSTIAHIDVSTLYSGQYLVELTDGVNKYSKQIQVLH